MSASQVITLDMLRKKIEEQRPTEEERQQRIIRIFTHIAKRVYQE